MEFSREEKNAIVAKIQSYFSEELRQDIGQFDAEFLLDFFAEEIGPYFYNRGIHDAQASLEQRMDGLKEAIWMLEKPTELRG